MTDDILDAKGIAELLGYAHESTARWLCRSGRLKSARKYGSSCAADRGEVLAYRLLHKDETRGRKKRQEIERPP